MTECSCGKINYCELYLQLQSWLYRNGRQIDIAMWKYYFQNGAKEDVVNALMEYQNDDGGFGHALEADNWNPESTPITTHHAVKILSNIDFLDMNHPIYKGIWKYLYSEKDLLSYGWRFTVAGNDEHPHAPWWNYNEEENAKEYYGVTAGFCEFILKFGDKETALYQTARRLTNELINALVADGDHGDMGLESYIKLIDVLKECKCEEYDFNMLEGVISKKVTHAIEHDIEKWTSYVPRPSNFIKSPKSPFYDKNKEIVHRELKYLLETKPENDVWGITWTWFGNMKMYEKYFYISENWWKASRLIDNVQLLRNFEIL